jgi:hypothetical protein
LYTFFHLLTIQPENFKFQPFGFFYVLPCPAKAGLDPLLSFFFLSKKKSKSRAKQAFLLQLRFTFFIKEHEIKKRKRDPTVH